MTDFQTILEDAIYKGDCLALVLSKKRAAAGDLPGKLSVRPVTVSGRAAYQFVLKQNGKETHENHQPAEAHQRIVELFGPAYAHCHLFTTKADYSARISTGGKIRHHKSSATKTPTEATHNRSKTYLIPEGVVCPFLVEIGVMTRSGQVRSAKYQKFRQINRFLELIDDIVDQLPAEGTINVVDFGCGKSYLTFALHHLLTAVHGRNVDIVGLDRNPDVIRDCAEIGRRLECAGLEFRVGDIARHQSDVKVHLAVSLHACDTATDDALAQAIRWQADVILAVPCCQHELADKIESSELSPLLEHGILKERFAALTTDALRARALEISGYRTQVVEFIDMEHTPKNILIRAVRSDEGLTHVKQSVREYQRLKQALGLKTIYLEETLGTDFDDRLRDGNHP